MATMCERIRQIIVDEFDPNDVTVMKYSGRNMYGRSCLALSGSSDACMRAIGVVIQTYHDDVSEGFANDDGDTFANEENFSHLLAKLFDDMRMDNLGHDVVIYWPDIDWVENADISDDTDDNQT